MEWNEELKVYTYPFPCGDLFQITKDELKIGEEIARCPSCSLYSTTIYNMEDFVGSRSDPNESFRGVLLRFRCGITRNGGRNS
ncbi:putative DPH-type metal-binding domain-containing protein [Helianthus annuus]|uniref:Diphthamide biosynthesis protein 3 n=1 Tax=Helianthus annuus TaxID=4232 RepID=A0A251UB03_HELAN|nr:putative Zinc finger, DPH-type, DPH Zinc finger superfamily [Helianthus annuus]KAJ0563501.1 putative diphthamide biosynthesis protein [Helianthus annuus]KAJ0731597.1 putative diphthamide biosynthesis protein [Helianthus annuus]KAJ0908420.1 putative DPH-type metal-binding domain-containing protein [Helianthus annuus]